MVLVAYLIIKAKRGREISDSPYSELYTRIC